MRATFVALLLATTACCFVSSPSSHSTHRRHRGKRASVSPDGWVIDQTLTGQDFIEFFDFDEKPSDNEGIAEYVDGVKEGLVYTDDDGKVRIGVETTEQAEMRKAVRMVSKKTFNPSDNLLFVFDVQQMPGVCGAWPAIWMTGSGTWPDTGEIDIVEGVNAYTKNTMSVHTNAGCSMNGNKVKNSKLVKTDATNCDAIADIEACGVSLDSITSFGPGSNNARGSTYALEMTTAGIKMWWWNNGNGPLDVTAGVPAPSTWDSPTFELDSDACEIGAHFVDMMLIVNTNLGGFFPSGVWSTANAGGQEQHCQSMTGIDNVYDYVKGHGSAFQDDEWIINGFYIYKKD